MYSIEQLLGMIATNNLAAIHSRLVQEGRVSSMTAPSADSLGYAMQEQAARLSSAQFHDWLQTLLDVPVNQTGMYSHELLAIPTTTGKSPAKTLVDMMREQTPASNSGNSAGMVWNQAVNTPWWVWLLLVLALIGALSAVGYVGRLLRKIAE